MQNGSIITINSTCINCILGGGRSGNYDVIVQNSANGQSVANVNAIFSYKIVITNLSLSISHKGGGYNLTINGFNFATSAGINNFFIGDALNSICKILSYTSTSIVCQVPRMMNDYRTGQLLNVVVTGKVIEQSVC